MDDFCILDAHNHPFKIQLDDPLILDPIYLKLTNKDLGGTLIPIDVKQQFTAVNDDQLIFETIKTCEILLYCESYTSCKVVISFTNTQSFDQTINLIEGSCFILPITRFEQCRVKLNFNHFKKGLLKIEQYSFSQNFSSLLCVSGLKSIIPILNSEYAITFTDSHIISINAWNDLKSQLEKLKRITIDLYEQESEINNWIIHKIQSEKIVENVLIWKNMLEQFFSELKKREKTCKICQTNI